MTQELQASEPVGNQKIAKIIVIGQSNVKIFLPKKNAPNLGHLKNVQKLVEYVIQFARIMAAGQTNVQIFLPKENAPNLGQLKNAPRLVEYAALAQFVK